MIRTFQVAGLSFSLDLPDDFPAADLLHNYDPFLCHSERSEESIFSLKISDKAPGAPGEALMRGATGEPVVGFFRSGEGYQAAFAPTPGARVCGVLEMSGDFRVGQLYTEGSPADRTFAVNNALMLLYAFASAPYAALELHASVVTRGGRGFLFLGKSGTGKSTHTRLWLKHISGTELLNDDNPVLRIVDGVARVYGSPWSGKTPCYKAQDAPIGAIVRLSQAPQNRIERLSTVQAYASVMASCSGFRPIRTLADAQHETLSQIAQLVPCYHLDCLPDADAARLCQETVDG
ncbi:MAG: hypothetical protein J6W01_04575 [Bacteroidales bacterium]|nr:hypothetical protein [Bacteroidales bacterium]